MFRHIPERFQLSNPHKQQGPGAHRHSLTWQAITLHLQWGGIPFLMTDALQGTHLLGRALSHDRSGNWPNKPSQPAEKCLSISAYSFTSSKEMNAVGSFLWKTRSEKRPEEVWDCLNSMSIHCFVCFLILLTHPKIKYIFEKGKKRLVLNHHLLIQVFYKITTLGL